jgi:hypothetical protein
MKQDGQPQKGAKRNLLWVLRLLHLFAAKSSAFFFCCVSAIIAQPSGGPYGPQRQTYSPPAGAAHVYYVAPDGNPNAAGTALDQPSTLEAALARAVTNDAIILRGGTYRVGDLKLNQGVTLQPHADEEPVLKGTRVATKWDAQENGLWKTKWSPLFPAKPADWWRRGREGRKTPLHRFNNDMVFLDGQMLEVVGWEGEVDAHSCYIDYDAGEIYVGTDPTNRLVEITAFDNALTRVIGSVHGKTSDRKGLIIRGLTFTQYAFRALEIQGRDPEGVSPESGHGKDVVGSLLENVTITHCSRVAGYFRGDRLTLRNCRISDTGTEGIFILSSNDVLLERNIFQRNNVEQITGYYPAAVKIFNQCHRVTCRDNLVIDQPHSNGIWYDVGNVDGVFVHNWIEGAIDGFFFEISRNAICAGNVFVHCDKGVRVLNSAGVQVYHNTFVNTVASFERTERSAVGDHFGWHPRTGPDVEQRDGHAFVGNLLVADESFSKQLLRFDQPAALKSRLTKPQVTRLNDNVYVRRQTRADRSVIAWSPTATNENQVYLPNPAALTALNPQFESRSVLLNRDYRSVIRSPELGHFDPVVDLPRTPNSEAVPSAILTATGWKDAPHSAGAYPRAK